MTKQEIFEKVVIHLRNQGRRATGKSHPMAASKCKYRTSDGLKCGIGCLIPDELYDPSFEGKSVTCVARRLHAKFGVDRFSLYPNDFVTDGFCTPAADGILASTGAPCMYLEDLQGIHDSWDETPTDLEERVSEFASTWGVDVPSSV